MTSPGPYLSNPNSIMYNDDYYYYHFYYYHFYYYITAAVVCVCVFGYRARSRAQTFTLRE